MSQAPSCSASDRLGVDTDSPKEAARKRNQLQAYLCLCIHLQYMGSALCWHLSAQGTMLRGRLQMRFLFTY